MITPAKIYTEPKLVKGASSWYIEFQFWNGRSFERVRKTDDYNRKSKSPTEALKEQNFHNLLQDYKNRLLEGYNPFQSLESIEVVVNLGQAKDFFKSNKIDVRPKTMANYLGDIGQLIKQLGELKRLSTITSQIIVDALVVMENTSRHGEWRNVTFNNMRTSLYNFFQLLVDRDYMKKNPISGIKMRKKQVTITHEVFADEDRKVVLKHLDVVHPQLALFCRIMYYTCIRPSELRKLQVKHVNVEKRVITVPETISKNNEEGYVHIDDAVMWELEKLNLSDQPKDHYLFTNKYKKFTGPTPLGVTTMYMRFAIALKELGLNDKKYTMYSWKHTSNVKKYHAGWTIAEICAGNRHKSLVQTETYLKALLKFAPVAKSMPSVD
jgi:integrase